MLLAHIVDITPDIEDILCLKVDGMVTFMERRLTVEVSY